MKSRHPDRLVTPSFLMVRLVMQRQSFSQTMQFTTGSCDQLTETPAEVLAASVLEEAYGKVSALAKISARLWLLASMAELGAAEFTEHYIVMLSGAQDPAACRCLSKARPTTTRLRSAPARKLPREGWPIENGLLTVCT